MKSRTPLTTGSTLKALGMIASATAFAAPTAASAQGTCSISPAMQSAPIADSASTFTASCTTPPRWYTWEVIDQMNGIRQGASIANPQGDTSFSFTPVSHLGEGTYTIKLSADLAAPGLPSAYQDFRATLVVSRPVLVTPDPQPQPTCPVVSPPSACQQPPQPVCKITPATQVTPVGNTARKFSVSCNTAFYRHGWMLTDSNNVATGVTSPPGAAMQSEFTTPGNLAAGTYMIDFSASFEQTTAVPDVRPVDRAVLVVAEAAVQTWPPAPPAKGYRVDGRIKGYASSRLKMLDTATAKSYFCDVRGTHYSCAFEDYNSLAPLALTPVGMVSKTKQDGSRAFTEDKAIVFNPAVVQATCAYVRTGGTMSPLLHFCGDGMRYASGPSLVVRGGAFSFDDKSEAILNCAEELLKDILPEPQVTSIGPDMRVRRYSSDWAIGIAPAQDNQGNFVFASPGVKWFTTLASIDAVNSNFCGQWQQ
ncbi:MAG TPA: hypothetical protein VGE39_17875 [Prosthecobacter sp.]